MSLVLGTNHKIALNLYSFLLVVKAKSLTAYEDYENPVDK